jgi:hypothetical protein
MKLTDQIMMIQNHNRTRIYGPQLCPVEKYAISDAMDSSRSQVTADLLQLELTQIMAQEREVLMQYQIIRAHLETIRRRRDFLEEQIVLASQGQLSLDPRPHPDLS